jgi:hypothetical protein
LLGGLLERFGNGGFGGGVGDEDAGVGWEIISEEWSVSSELGGMSVPCLASELTPCRRT